MQRTLAAAEALDDGNIGGDASRRAARARAAARGSRLPQAVVESAISRAAGGRELEQLPAKACICGERDVDDLAAGRLAASTGPPRAAPRSRDRLAAQHREAAADRHHHVGVVHGPAGGVRRTRRSRDRSRAAARNRRARRGRCAATGSHRRRGCGRSSTRLPVPSRTLPRPRDGERSTVRVVRNEPAARPARSPPRAAPGGGSAPAWDTAPRCRRRGSSPSCWGKSRRASRGSSVSCDHDHLHAGALQRLAPARRTRAVRGAQCRPRAAPARRRRRGRC